MSSTLFGHLATRFATHPENLATEALGYILRETVVARDAIQELLAHSDMPIQCDLVYQNQVGGEDEGQPDVVGIDAEGRQRLVIEAKFWAGLTDHQPVTYLERLPKDGGVLLFVAPAARETLLWGELTRRCTDAELIGRSSSNGTLRGHMLADGRHLALVSWRSLLEFILGRVEVAGDRKIQSDIAQLLGLCEYMDTTAFLPLTSEEVTSNMYKRVLQFADLADDAVSVLVENGVAETKGLNRQPFKGISGRYFRFRGAGAYLSCDLYRWNTLAATPIWLTFGQSFFGGCPSDLMEALAPLAAMTPPRLFIDRGLPTIPIYVPTQKTRDEVLQAILEQLRDIERRIPRGLEPASVSEALAMEGLKEIAISPPVRRDGPMASETR